jgi:iron complex transport system ATP-binding protein
MWSMKKEVTMLSAENIQYSVGKKAILNGVTAAFHPGEFNMILGPNGSGKSTFLKIFAGEISHFKGNVFYNDEDIHVLDTASLAKQRAVMSQQPELSFPLAVEEVVMMGRYPHFTFNPGNKDERICDEVIQQLKLQPFRDRNYLTLSGGEKQRVQFARMLAQIWETPDSGFRYIFLDEPLNNLDISFQQEFLQVCRMMADKKTVLIAVMHDINLALQYADKVFFLKNGYVLSNGKPAEIVTEELIEEVFDVKVNIIKNPITNLPLIIFGDT